MRVLHVITTLAGGGAERFVSQLTPAIARTGVRTGVMTVYPSAIPHEVASADVDVVQISRKGRYDAGFLPRMISEMRAWRPDVVHTHMHNGTYWGRAAAIAASVPVIVRTEHAPCDPSIRARGTFLADRVLNRATAAIVTFLSEQGQMLAAHERFDPAKLAIIPNGISHAAPPNAQAIVDGRNRLGVPPATFAIVQLGNLHRPKNQRLSIEMLSKIDPVLRGRIRLVFVGDGADRDMLGALARERGVKQLVRFLGYRNDAMRLLPGADLAIMPSLSEGMPLAMLEAMSAGVPVLTTPWPGARDLLAQGACGTISADWEPETLARCVEAIVDDLPGARAIAKHAQAVVRREYDIARTAERHRELYQRLTARRAA